MYKIISSKENQQIKDLSKLIKQKKERDVSQLFVLEGAKLCADAIDSGIDVVKAFYTKPAETKYHVTEILKSSAKEAFEISETIAQWVSDTKTPQGLFAVCKMRNNSENAFSLKSDGRYLVLENLQDPGNVGTIVRTSLALGIDAVIISADSADIYSPKVIRSSTGSVMRLPIVMTNDLIGTVNKLRSAGIKTYAAALEENAKSVNDGLFTGGCAVVIGNEGNGLSQAVIDVCDETVIIPMLQGAESLNAGVAASILIWEMSKGKIREKE